MPASFVVAVAGTERGGEGSGGSIPPLGCGWALLKPVGGRGRQFSGGQAGGRLPAFRFFMYKVADSCQHNFVCTYVEEG